MNQNTRNPLPNLLAIEEPDWESWAGSQIWHVYEAMFLLLGALPMVGYNGTKPMFALTVSHGDESTDKTVSRFFTLWEKLYRDVDDAAILQELPVIPKDQERGDGVHHGWELCLVWDQEWSAMVTGSDGCRKWEPIPKDRIGVDVCLKRCRPADFLRWAESRGYDIPEELRPLLEDGETGEISPEQTAEQRNSASQAREASTQKDTPLHREDSLAVFREMDNLRFEEIDICLNPEPPSLTIRARGKEERSVPLSALGLTKKNGMTLSAQGNAFFGMASGEYTTHSKSARERLSKELKEAFGTNDTPISKGKPLFKLRIPKDDAAKLRARRNPVSYRDNSSHPYEDEDDEAAQWLSAHDKV